MFLSNQNSDNDDDDDDGNDNNSSSKSSTVRVFEKTKRKVYRVTRRIWLWHAEACITVSQLHMSLVHVLHNVWDKLLLCDFEYFKNETENKHKKYNKDDYR
jgi:hypothetical protein